MQKIISLFQRNYDGDRLVRNEDGADSLKRAYTAGFEAGKKAGYMAGHEFGYYLAIKRCRTEPELYLTEANNEKAD